MMRFLFERLKVTFLKQCLILMPYLCKSEELLLNLFDIEHNFVHSIRACDLNHLVLEFYCLLRAWLGIYLAFHLLFLLLHSMPPIRYQVIILTNVLYKQT